jgi:membrane-bound lytic murein transglycosylase D
VNKNALQLVLLAGAAYVAYALYSGQNWAVSAISSVWGSAWLQLGNAPDYVPTLNQIEASTGLPTNLLCAVAYQESNFSPDAVNASSGATGMFQLMPQYYPNAGVSWQADAQTAATALLGYFNEFGDWQSALAAYNWGPGSLQNSGATSLAQLPQETQTYVSNIVSAVPVSGPFVSVA